MLTNTPFQYIFFNSIPFLRTIPGGEIIYFELDAAGQLMEMGTLDLGKEISSLDMGLVPAGTITVSIHTVSIHAVQYTPFNTPYQYTPYQYILVNADIINTNNYPFSPNSPTPPSPPFRTNAIIVFGCRLLGSNCAVIVLRPSRCTSAGHTRSPSHTNIYASRIYL